MLLLVGGRDLGEGVDQRRGREHDQLATRRSRRAAAGRARAAAAAAARGHKQRQHQQQQSRPHSRATITEVALTVATALTPGTRPSSSTASRVITDTMWLPPDSISTCAITPVTSTLVTTPSNRLRAENEVSTWWTTWPSRRAISSSSTTRRLAESRSVTMRPLRSQRRSVSTLTPSARAASPTGSIRPIEPRTLAPTYHLCKV